jgi:UDP-sugar pyrophosphorylase
LLDAKQESIAEELKTWPVEQQAAFMQQLVWLDKVTPTGLVKYCERGRQLLSDSAGFSIIKISLPVVTIEDDYSYLRYYAEYALACKAAALKRDPSLDAATFYVPFAIMTSDDTYARTMELLESHDWFGLTKERVDIVKQENVPALIDNTAKLAVNNGKIDTKPHGHGDIHNLLFDSGVAAKWQAMGKEWMVFIQDTNALALKALPSVLGVSRKHNWEMNTVCVPRKPGEAMGAICRLINEQDPNDELVINVEYNQLDSLLRQKWNP